MASDRSSHRTRTIPKDVSSIDVEHFSSLEFARHLLDDPSFSIFPMARTAVNDSERHHTLMAQTWNTADTIAHMLTLTKTVSSESVEVCRFYTFGSGLNAHADQLHGGVVAAILDSTLSTTAYVGSQQVSRDDWMSVATLQLNIKYQRPVPTPGSLMVTAKVKRIEDGGRKIWVEGSVKGGDSGEVSHAMAEGMWLRIKIPKEKL